MAKEKGISLAELERIRKQEKSPRFTAENERRHALRLLADIADLSQRERARVLRRAHDINEV